MNVEKSREFLTQRAWPTGFEESAGEVLADMFAQRHQELFGVVAVSGTSYGRLDWRLDIQASQGTLSILSYQDLVKCRQIDHIS